MRETLLASLALALCVAGAIAAQRSSTSIADLRTRAETSNFEETSTHAEVARLVESLATSPLVHVETFGKTGEGRDLPLVVIADPKVASPEAARRTGRPVVLVQANIHGGEVEGKEASLALARRLIAGDLRPLTRQLVVLIAPDYNADGNDKISTQNRSAQNGPIAGVGTRENAKGLDLNRDYMKLDTPEARGLIGLMNRWDPHVAVDLHTTNGSYHGYHLTYSPILNPNADARLIQFERATLLPTIRQAMVEKHKFRTYYYGNFTPERGGGNETSRVDPSKPGDVTWQTFDHRPRFGNSYVGLRNRLAILSEAYSYLDFKGRVDVTAAFVEELLKATAANAKAVLSLTAAADRDLQTAPAASKPIELGVAFEMRALPDLVPILVGDVTRKPNPRSGRDMSQMTDMAVAVPMKDYGVFVATRSIAMPQGWILPRQYAEDGRLASAIERLRWHGIAIDTFSAATQAKVERFTIKEFTRAERSFQDHREAKLTGQLAAATVPVEAGSLFISARQPLGRLAFYLLEAESDDSLVTWNVIERGLAPGEMFPVYRAMDASAFKLTRRAVK